MGYSLEWRFRYLVVRQAEVMIEGARVGWIGLVLLGLFGCAGSSPPRSPETVGLEVESRAAPSKRALSDLVPVKDFVGTLPPSVSCGAPCAPGEESLRVGGSCLCAADVRSLTSQAPAPDRWFVARGESLVEAERSPLKACGEAPLEERSS